MSADLTLAGSVEDRLAQESALLDRICARLMQEATRHGLAAPDIDPALARYVLKPDPFTGEVALIGNWPADKAGRKGNLIINGDGSFFAEYDVLVRSESNPKQFVEATTAWGRSEKIGAELRMLDYPE